MYHTIHAEVRGDAGILLTCEAAHGCWVHVRQTPSSRLHTVSLCSSIPC
jgi:hypothetical protein